MSDSLSFVTVDVFTDTPYQGNPLAICLIKKDQHVSDEKLQLIAREFNLSETVFLYDDADHGTEHPWRMRIFVVDAELPFAGHPTIGTAHHLLTTYGLTSARLLCKAGEINVTLEQGITYATIPSNFHCHKAKLTARDIETVQPALRDHANSILRSNIVSPVKGMNFVVSELASLEALAAVDLPVTDATVALDEEWNTGFVGTAFYVATGVSNGIASYRTRMVTRAMEDPATGSLSCALAVLLASSSAATTAHFEFVQGVEMGRESRIGVVVSLKDGKESKVTLYGTAIAIMHGDVRL